jgi:hypothetical protein
MGLMISVGYQSRRAPPPRSSLAWSIRQLRHDADELLEVCGQRDGGIHIIKTVARNP